MDFVFNLQYYSTIYYNMFSCNDCSFSSELDLYCKHVKLWHQKSHYNCGQGGCGNVYSDIKALKRHLKSNHITSATATFSTNSNCYNIKDPFVATVNSEITLNDEHNEQANEQVSVKDIVEKYRLYTLSLYIIYILEDSNKSITMFTHKLFVVNFDIHYQCYLVIIKSDICKTFNFEDLQYFPKNIHVLATGELAVRPPEKM